MAKYTWAETFISLEGEFLYQGYPTVYVRFARCNFTCQNFNNPEHQEITNEVLGFDPANYTNVKRLPLITKGCDSLYAHDKRFAHMWKTGNEVDLAEELLSLLPKCMWQNKLWHHPETNQPYILSITGGEPTLYQKTIPTLINCGQFDDLQLLLIETNCAVPIRDEFIVELNNWCAAKSGRKVIWSNSPKLSASGESWKNAIIPEIARKQLEINNCQQYFKFVCGPRQVDVDEVKKAMKCYHSVGVPLNTPVGIMPESCTAVQQEEISQAVAAMCIDQGFIYVSRLQNYLWGNEVGT